MMQKRGPRNFEDSKRRCFCFIRGGGYSFGSPIVEFCARADIQWPTGTACVYLMTLKGVRKIVLSLKH